VSRDERSPRELVELAALDRILAREPVGEEHLELAALVDSVRAGAPRIDASFEASLGARFARPQLGTRRVAWRTLAVGSSAVVAAAVALTIVLSGSVRHDIFGGGATPVAPLRVLHSGGAAVGAPQAPARSPSAIAAPAAHALAQPRLVQKGSTLTLSTPPAQMQGVANRIVAATEGDGGVVERSSVDVQGSSSHASFSLQVPSGRLRHLIAQLSSLASVRSLNQGTTDITAPYDSETALLASRIAQRAALRRQLATAPTATALAALQRQIAELNHRIAIERATIARLRSEAANATLAVEVLPGAAARRSHSSAGALTKAYHDALGALEEILAIALVVLAIVLPFALCALALWWAASVLRQRSRERALRSA
jgi:hypothetical protein